jgi:hypothetical protein
MGIEKILKGIALLLDTNRGQGHTTAALDGVVNRDNAVLLTRDSKHAQQIKTLCRDVAMSPGRGDLPVAHSVQDLVWFVGRRVAVVLDNFTVSELCHRAVLEIERLEAKLSTEKKDRIAAEVEAAELAAQLKGAQAVIACMIKETSVLHDANARLRAEIARYREAYCDAAPPSQALIRRTIMGWLREKRPDLIDETLEQWRLQDAQR